MVNDIILSIIALIGAYILGSIPAAYIAGRLGKGIDIRTVGSHNVGAMNVFYEVGIAAGILVLIVDIGKGAAAVALARFLDTPLITQLIAGIVAIVGHDYTLFLKFKGGKGGATAIGVLAYLMPWGIPFYAGIAGLSTLLTRQPVFSYSIAFLAFPFVGWLWYDSWIYAVFSVVVVIIPAIKYVPRVKEMYAKGGARKIFFRRSFKERL